MNVLLAIRKPLSEGFRETREDKVIEWDSNWIAELTKRLFFDSSFLLSDADHTRLNGMKIEDFPPKNTTGKHPGFQCLPTTSASTYAYHVRPRRLCRFR